MTQDGARRSRSPARRAPKFSSAVSKTRYRKCSVENAVPAGRSGAPEPISERGSGGWPAPSRAGTGVCKGFRPVVDAQADAGPAVAASSAVEAGRKVRGEGKGHTPLPRSPVVSRRAGAAVPSDWKVVSGHAVAISAGSASHEGHAETENRSDGRLMVVKP